MKENLREHFRICPKSLSVIMAEKEVRLLDISLGGAKFKVKTFSVIKKYALILLLDKTNALEVFFNEEERKGDVFRVRFINMSAHVESLLAKYIMNWQSKRAYLSKIDDKSDIE